MTQSCVATMVVFAHCTLCIGRRERTDLSEYIGSMDVSQIAQHMQLPDGRIQMQALSAFKYAGGIVLDQIDREPGVPGVRKI